MKSKDTFIVNLNLDWRILLILAAIFASLWFAYSAVSAKSNPKPEIQNNPIQEELYSAPQAVSAAPGGNGKHFYLTLYTFLPTQAITACDSGYHMASLWEILDGSNLVYDINNPNAAKQVDSGWGPPANLFGWIRTGYGSSGSSTPGTGNCQSWGVSDGANYGTIASLPNNWSAAPTFFTWWTNTIACNTAVMVWCVEN